MSALFDFFLVVANRARYFVPGLALSAAAAFVQHPAALILLLAAQPLYMAAAVTALGYNLESNFVSLALRRGVVYFTLIAIYAGVVALAIGIPLLRLNQDPSTENMLLLSLGIGATVGILWRLWPVFGFAFLWADAYNQYQGSWIITAIKRILKLAYFASEREHMFGLGVLVTMTVLFLVTAALALAGFNALIPQELQRLAGLAYGLLFCPCSAFLIAWASERVLLRKFALDETKTNAIAEFDLAAAPTEKTTKAPMGQSQLDRETLAAAGANQVDRALALLAAGASADAMPDVTDKDQRSLVIIAVTLPDLRLLRELISRRVDLNRAPQGLSPLIAATRDSYQGRPDAVMMLLTNGADPNAADHDGNAPLHYAALSCDPTVAAVLLDAGARIDSVNRDGQTALNLACVARNEAMARFLLDRGAGVAAAGANPALIAACRGAEEGSAIVKLLLKHKARIQIKDNLGRTALHAAALHGHADTAELLIQQGIAIDAQDQHGVTALMETARAGTNAVLQRLLPGKPDPNLIDHAGRTALMIACQSRQANEETARLLLNLNPDIQKPANDGRRAVDFAMVAGRWNIVALLDPSCILPSSLTDPGEFSDVQQLLQDQTREALLLNALKHQRWALAESLLGLEAPLPAESWADLLKQLAGSHHAHAFNWLLRAAPRPEPAENLLSGLLLDLTKGETGSFAAVKALLDLGLTGQGATLLALLDREWADVDARDLESMALHQLLQRGADPFLKNKSRQGLLHLAVLRQMPALAEDLLARGANPNDADQRGRTALHELALCPNMAWLAKRFLEKGADPEKPAADGQTPLGAALAAGNIELVDWLAWNSGYRFPARLLFDADLPAAAAQGDLAAVKRLLALGLPIDAQDAQGCTALLRACGKGYYALASFLLSAHADPMIPAATGASALSAAITSRNQEIVQLLLAHQVPPDLVLPGDITPLMVAAALGHVAIVSMLLDYQADADAMDEQGNTALHAAAQFCFRSDNAACNRQLAQCLIDAAIAPNAQNRMGQTPLLLLLGAAAPAGSASPQAGFIEIIAMMLDAGADLAAQDVRGVSILHAIAMHGLKNLCQPLLQMGANPALRDRLGRMPHEIALMLGHAELARMLKRGLG